MKKIFLALMLVPLLLVGCNKNKEESQEANVPVEQYINVPVNELVLMEEETYQINTEIIKLGTIVFYSSDDEEVVSISDDGMVTALKAGETTINIRGGKDIYVIFITVTPYQAKDSLQIVLQKESFTLEAGDEYVLPLTVKFGNEVIDNPTISYSYENEGIVSIAGINVRALLAGTTKCVATATYENKEVSKSFTITVY